MTLWIGVAMTLIAFAIVISVMSVLGAALSTFLTAIDKPARQEKVPSRSPTPDASTLSPHPGTSDRKSST